MTSNRPYVSVIMPVRNEGPFMKQSLQAILLQDYPQECLEVMVVDGMSDDETRGIIQDFKKLNPNILLMDNPKKIVSAGLNLALREAKGKIIIRVDGHCEIAPDYVSRCVELLEKGEADMVGGPIETMGETPLAQAIALAMSSFFGVGGSAFRTLKNQKKYVDTVAFFACRRELLEKAGPFDEELVRNQDDEYNYRLRKMGFRILLDPAIRSRYYSRASLASLWKQYFQYGFWKIRVLQKHPRQMQWRQFVPPVFTFSLPASLAAGFFMPSAASLFFLILIFYAAADGLASFWLSAQKQWKFFPLLLVIHPVLHLSYGLGFITGLVRFRNRWRDR